LTALALSSAVASPPLSTPFTHLSLCLYPCPLPSKKNKAAADTGLRKAVRDRLLVEMLSGVQDPAGAGWKVLVMDGVTTRVMSTALKMSDLQEAGEWVDGWIYACGWMERCIHV